MFGCKPKSYSACHSYQASIAQSSFSGNLAGSAGGALFLVNVAFSASSSNFTYNVAAISGSFALSGKVFD